MTGAAVFKCCYYVDTVLLVWQQEDAKKAHSSKTVTFPQEDLLDT